MNKHESISVYDYDRIKLCDLYDSNNDLIGQAYDINVTQNIDGTHAIEFKLPNIINSGHVQFMRDKNCFGVWCNANIFASKYNLTGLVTGMVISEIAEAYMWNIPVADQEEMDAHDNFWCNALKECFDNAEITQVPQRMYDYISDRHMTPLEDFNFNSIWYFDKGEEIY